MLSKYINNFAQLLQGYFQTEVSELAELIQLAPEKVAGDLAFPCFQFAKTLGKSPVQIAQEVAENLKTSDLGIFEKIEAI